MMKFDNIINKGVRLLNLYFEYKYCFNTSECTCNTVRFLNKDSGFPKMWYFEEGGPSTIWCFFKLFQEKSTADCLRRGEGGLSQESYAYKASPDRKGLGAYYYQYQARVPRYSRTVSYQYCSLYENL